MNNHLHTIKIFTFLLSISLLANGVIIAQEREEYPAVPHANLNIEGMVPLFMLEQIANRHAHGVWGDTIACGQPLPIADGAGNLIAYVFPFIRGSQKFSGYKEIFDLVRYTRKLYYKTHESNDKQFEAYFAHTEDRFGSIYVSATRKNPPILRVDHSLHPYFISAEKAQEKAQSQLQSSEVRLEKIFSVNPNEEYFEFTSDSRRILLDVHSLDVRESTNVLTQKPDVATSAELDMMIKTSWERMEGLVSHRIDKKNITSSPQFVVKYLASLPLVPPLIWTLNCATTSKAMVLGYWDHYVPGSGTKLGFGRLIDYWYEHPSNGENVPNLLEEVHAANGIDVWQVNNYSCEWTEIPANSANNWAWQEYTTEIDNDHPTCWSIVEHTTAGVGYRTDPIEPGARWAIIYNTWTTNLSEYNYIQCKGIAHIIPQGGSNGDHMVITSPYSGETYWTSTPAEIVWNVWGQNIDKTNLQYSADGGLNWTLLASDIPTHEGSNSYYWIPGQSTVKGRIRVQCYSGSEYIAGDGSFGNFSIQPQVAEGDWMRISDPVDMVVTGYEKSTGNRLIYATDKTTGDLYQFTGIPNASWNWIKVGLPGKKFVLDGQGNLYGLSIDGNAVYKYSGTPMVWSQIGGLAGEIYSDLDGVCKTDPTTGDLYRYLGSPYSWLKVGGPGRDFVYDSKGNLFCLAVDGSGVWRYDGGVLEPAVQWVQVGGAAENLYGNGLGVYMTSSITGDIYFFHGIPFQWSKVGGQGSAFSVDVEGRPYALTTDKTGVMRYDGSLSNPTKWTKIGGVTTGIYTGYREILAINPETNELWIYTSLPTAVNENKERQDISCFSLMQNYPNPFNPSTMIEFQIPKSGHVTLTVYNLLGMEVKTLVNEEMKPGSYKSIFDGSSLASGVYLYRIQANGFVQSKKFVLLK
jgi:hypothetical protein